MIFFHKFTLTVKQVIFASCFLISFSTYSQELRDQAVKNIGSSVAYLALCEKEKLINENFTSRIMLATQKNLGKLTYEKIRDQYQNSLHEKKQYSISTDKWVPMKINKVNCKDLEDAAPVLLNHINEIGKNYKK
jgi:hypothetical protein